MNEVLDKAVRNPPSKRDRNLRRLIREFIVSELGAEDVVFFSVSQLFYPQNNEFVCWWGAKLNGRDIKGTIGISASVLTRGEMHSIQHCVLESLRGSIKNFQTEDGAIPLAV